MRFDPDMFSCGRAEWLLGLKVFRGDVGVGCAVDKDDLLIKYTRLPESHQEGIGRFSQISADHRILSVMKMNQSGIATIAI